MAKLYNKQQFPSQPGQLNELGACKVEFRNLSDDRVIVEFNYPHHNIREMKLNRGFSVTAGGGTFGEIGLQHKDSKAVKIDTIDTAHGWQKAEVGPNEAHVIYYFERLDIVVKSEAGKVLARSEATHPTIYYGLSKASRLTTYGNSVCDTDLFHLMHLRSGKYLVSKTIPGERKKQSPRANVYLSQQPEDTFSLRPTKPHSDGHIRNADVVNILTEDCNIGGTTSGHDTVGLRTWSTRLGFFGDVYFSTNSKQGLQSDTNFGWKLTKESSSGDSIRFGHIITMKSVKHSSHCLRRSKRSTSAALHVCCGKCICEKELEESRWVIMPAPLSKTESKVSRTESQEEESKESRSLSTIAGLVFAAITLDGRRRAIHGSLDSLKGFATSPLPYMECP